MSKAGFLLDINVLIALVDEAHTHHALVTKWFDSIGAESWGICALTEAGFLRVLTRPKTGVLKIDEATEILERLAVRPGYRFWPMSKGWLSTALLFKGRIFGHQQVKDAILLGQAVQNEGVFVTLDKAIGHIAAKKYACNLLVLE